MQRLFVHCEALQRTHAGARSDHGHKIARLHFTVDPFPDISQFGSRWSGTLL
jgi:hypothetical protein